MARITVYTGNYGSGKTEISLNHAYKSARSGQPTTLVDLDIVNPYFRSAEHREALEKQGIAVYAPTFAGSAVDLPTLSADVYAVFERPGQIIFDVGGDPSGAAALGRFFPYFERLGDEVQMRFVVNARRPLSSTPEDIVQLLGLVQQKARLKAAGIINNTNVARDTTAQDVLEGQAIVEQAAKQMGLPILSIHATPQVIQSLPHTFIEQYEPLLIPLTPYMRPQWLDSFS